MDICADIPPLPDLLRLYGSVGWTAYTADPDRLLRAWQGSRVTLSAWEGDALIGALRVVGDGETILFIQDVLVAPGHQRQGVGTRLVQEALAACPDIRQAALLTDTTPETMAFYPSPGLVPAEEAGCTAFLRLKP